MIRTLLFTPADDARKVERAFATSADIVVLDLEDGVGPSVERKSAGRAQIARKLDDEPRLAGRCYVRLNPLASNHIGEDIDCAVAARVAGVVLPKCEGPQNVRELARRLTESEKVLGSKVKTLVLAIATETARGVQLLPHFEEPIPRLAGLLWGAEDLCADLGGTGNRDEHGRYLPLYRSVRETCLVAARAAGALAIDAVFTDFRSQDRLAEEAREARVMGFDGKAAIHPDQIGVIEAEFRPAATEIAWANEVLERFSDKSTSVVAMNGEMLDLPHLRRAQRILARAVIQEEGPLL